MSTISLNVSMEQIKQAMRQLPPQEKMALWRMLDEEVDRESIARRFSTAVKEIRATYAAVSEDEVMADAVKATRQVRKARHAQSRS
jgi:hypothetical protein